MEIGCAKDGTCPMVPFIPLALTSSPQPALPPCRFPTQGWAMYNANDWTNVRRMILGMAFESPLVILIKLADRLHNMRRQEGGRGRV